MRVLIIVVVSFLAYANTFSSPFLFDDGPNIRDNHLIRSWETAVDPGPYCAKVHPQSDEALICHFFTMRHVGYLSFALNYALHGLRVEGYHAVNFCIHLLNCMLVYALVLLLQKTPAVAAPNSRTLHNAAFLSSLLFSVHPLHTQAVTYLVQRLTSLAAFFYLFSLVLYLLARLRQAEHTAGQFGRRSSSVTVGFFVLSFVSAMAAMKTKEISFTLPVILILSEFLFFDGKVYRRVAVLLPFLLAMLIIPLQLIGIHRPLTEIFSDMGDVSRLRSDLPRLDYLFTQSTVIVRYLQLLLMPVGQNVDYDWPVYHSFFHPKVLFSSLLIFSLIGAGIYALLRYRKTAPALQLSSFGIFWFFVALSVESGLIPILDVIFEHRVYLPSVGFFIASAVLLTLVGEHIVARHPAMRKTVTAAAGIIIILLAGAAFVRNMIWQDEVAFWGDVVKKSPAKPRGYLNLGLAFQNRRDLDKALFYYNKALSMKALFYPPLVNRGSIYAAFGLHEQAIRDFTDAISINPYVAVAHYNRGMSYVFLGRKEDAIADFTSVIALKPTHAEAYNNRGSMYGDKGESEKAITDFTAAITLVPDFAGFYANRAHAYAARRDFAGAVRDLSRAIELSPNEASWYVRRGNAYHALARRREADADFRKACALGDAGGCGALK